MVNLFMIVAIELRTMRAAEVFVIAIAPSKREAVTETSNAIALPR
jgi:hypothetical protein